MSLLMVLDQGLEEEAEDLNLLEEGEEELTLVVEEAVELSLMNLVEEVVVEVLSLKNLVEVLS